MLKKIYKFVKCLVKNIIDKNVETHELEQFYLALDKTVAVTHSDLDGNITYVNDTFCKITGFTKKELLNKPHSILRFKEVSPIIFEEMWTTIQDKKSWNKLLPMVNKDGEILIFDTTIIPILNGIGKIVKYISIRTNVTQLSKLEIDLHNTQSSIIKALGEIAESNSKETAGHVVRVANYTRLIASLYGLNQNEIDILSLASQLHDIGKISIPESILGKPGKLNEEEMTVMRTHAEFGYNLLKHSELPILHAAAIISRDHHENWDGSGYPFGVKGTNIHLYGRIVALADVLDALCMKRVYKEAWSEDQALDFIVNQKGIKFDPKLVNLLMDNIDTFKKVKNRQMKHQSMEIPDMKTIKSMCNIDHPDIIKG